MIYNAKEFEKRGVRQPLLIGGATTSRAHTAIKIAPHFSQPVVHVVDASLVVGVCNSLLSENLRAPFLAEHQAREVKERELFAGKGSSAVYVPFEEAKRQKFAIDWATADIATPESIGSFLEDPVPLAEIVEVFDWTPFFHAWELRGVFPKILQHEQHGAEAQKLYDDARRILDDLVSNNRVHARGIWGVWPAASTGEDVAPLHRETRKDVLTTFHFLRQQKGKGPGRHALPEPRRLRRPAREWPRDYLGAFAVTAGNEVEESMRRPSATNTTTTPPPHPGPRRPLRRRHRRMAPPQGTALHGLRDRGESERRGRLTRSIAASVRRGVSGLSGSYREGNPVEPPRRREARRAMLLTTRLRHVPAEQCQRALLLWGEGADFGVGKIGRDQLEDYAARKGIALEEAEKWLAPYLEG